MWSPINLFPNYFLFYWTFFFSRSNHQFIKLPHKLHLFVIVWGHYVFKVFNQVRVALNDLEIDWWILSVWILVYESVLLLADLFSTLLWVMPAIQYFYVAIYSFCDTKAIFWIVWVKMLWKSSKTAYFFTFDWLYWTIFWNQILMVRAPRSF